MRDYHGIAYRQVEDETARRAFAAIDYFLRDVSRGFGRIQNGQVPDGSGDSIAGVIDLDDYLFLPGRFGGQQIEGRTNDLSPTVVINNPAVGTSTTGGLGTPFLRFAIGSTNFNFRPILNNGPLTDFGISLPFSNSGSNEVGFVVTNTSANASIRLVPNAGSSTRSFIQAGAVDSGGLLINNNLTIGGFNSRTLARLNFVATRASYLNADAGGTISADARVGINEDPFDYSSSAAASQPDALIVSRRTGATSGVPTMLVAGASSTEMAFALTGASLGSTPTKTISSPIAGFRHNGHLVMFNSTTAVGLLHGTNDVGATSVSLNVRDAAGNGHLTLGTVGAWSDSLTAASSIFGSLGTLVSSHRAFFLSSSTFNPFTRFGVSSAYTLISNGGAGGASNSFPAPEATPTVLRVYNSSTAGADGSVLLKLQSNRAGQSGDFLQCITSTPTTVFNVSSTGVITATGGASLGAPNDAAVSVIVGTDGSGSGGGFTLDDGSGFFGRIGTVGITAARTWNFPDGSGTIVVAGVKVSLTGGANSTFDTNTASSGAAFQDTTTTSKKLRFVLSGAVGNNSLTLTNTAARNYGLGNLGGNLEVVGDQAPAVSAGRMGKVDLTGQTAAIGSTNLTNSPPAGLYEVVCYVNCTNASGSGAPTLDVNIAWTDDVGATNRNLTADPGATAFALPLSATGRTSGRVLLQLASGNISYSTTINAASGSPAYSIYLRVRYLG